MEKLGVRGVLRWPVMGCDFVPGLRTLKPENTRNSSGDIFTERAQRTLLL